MKKYSCQAVAMVSFVAVLAGVPMPGLAQQAAAEKSALLRFAEQDYLLGDWGGLRSDLSRRGVDFEFFFAGSGPINLDGGLEHGGAYQGGLLMALTLDSEKLVGYDGGTFNVSSIWLHGEKPFSERYVGDLNKVNLIDFENSFRLWELWYEQEFWDGRASLKFGQMAIDRDFIVPEYYNGLASINLLNQTFFYPTMAFNVYDQPFFPVGHHALSSTPYGAPGIRLRIDPFEHAYFQIAAYDGNPDFSDSGTRISLRSDEGALLYAEIGLKINQTKEAQGPPGNIKLGAYYHTDDFYDIYQGTFNAFDNFIASQGIPLPPLSPGLARTREGNYGFYFLADQTLWREAGKEDVAQQGLVGFFRVATAPENRNLAKFGIDGGLVYNGLIPSRDWDTFSIAGSYMEISDDLSSAQRDINAALRRNFGLAPAFTKFADYEAVIEASYKAQLTAWWTLQPSVQRVIHPGGRVQANIPDAWVFILQTTLRF
ncbi:MAG TPA: carbohydrate porin [Methylomirabilota bacterium]|nr:carbohydrate porin [Methylomirabilota bacterium]